MTIARWVNQAEISPKYSINYQELCFDNTGTIHTAQRDQALIFARPTFVYDFNLIGQLQVRNQN
jgi:hypothetical protein